MIEQVKHDTISILCRIRVQSEEDLAAMEAKRKQEEQMKFQHAEASALSGAPSEETPQQAQPQTPFVRDGRKVGRNEPCPCGSGKKFKQCHGRLS
jgi:preprotein translocase subunit SecA